MLLVNLLQKDFTDTVYDGFPSIKPIKIACQFLLDFI